MQIRQSVSSEAICLFQGGWFQTGNIWKSLSKYLALMILTFSHPVLDLIMFHVQRALDPTVVFETSVESSVRSIITQSTGGRLHRHFWRLRGSLYASLRWVLFSNRTMKFSLEVKIWSGLHCWKFAAWQLACKL